MRVTNLKFDQGATWYKEFTDTNDDGSPFDLTGYSVRGQMRKSYGSTVVVVEFTGGVISGVNGVYFIRYAAVDSALVPPMSYVFDTECYKMEGSEEIVRRPYGGKILVLPEVTRGVGLPPVVNPEGDYTYDDGTTVTYDDGSSIIGG
ncbi:hypothetical protein UFOVP1419_37 [uncultured Caudovirales phage]|uniref:Uncharacterized protein n=1 Tax=uncultured Caudovirales phage TaxID=2100421 RepID=A0A6J5SDP6_9CAUD|nr:hypothetical protein UFOVP1419_37 [uncultured Caudovirales phage]